MPLCSFRLLPLQLPGGRREGGGGEGGRGGRGGGEGGGGEGGEGLQWREETNPPFFLMNFWPTRTIASGTRVPFSMLFGQISWSLRRFATATQCFQPPRNSSPESIANALQAALQQAGVRDWPKGNLRSSATQLKQLGSARAKQLLTWLLEADLALKGSHANIHRARFVLEQLFLKMSKAAKS